MAFQISGANQKIQLVTGSTGDIEVSCSFTRAPTALLSSSTLAPDATIGASIATATTTDIKAAAGASLVDHIKALSVANNHATTSNALIIQVTDSTNTVKLWGGTLLAGEVVVLDEVGDWRLYGADGKEKLSPGSGALIQTTLLTSGTTFTTNQSTRTIRLRMVAGGGGGAGCTSVAAAASAGGGGAAGGYAEKLFAVQPNTGYTYAIGAAGTGASGAAGNTGGNTTFAVGATTVTCLGGPGAPVATAVLTLIAYRGGLSPAISTNGDVNTGGDPGEMGLIYIAAGAGVSGKGGSGQFGSGGGAVTAVGNGIAGLGFGAGGGGALTGASAVRTGGSGTAGCIVVDEYT